MNADSLETQFARMDERMASLVRDQGEIRNELKQFRDQTHDWMKLMANKVPTWAILAGGVMASSMGAMATWILDHLR